MAIHALSFVDSTFGVISFVRHWSRTEASLTSPIKQSPVFVRVPTEAPGSACASPTPSTHWNDRMSSELGFQSQQPSPASPAPRSPHWEYFQRNASDPNTAGGMRLLKAWDSPHGLNRSPSTPPASPPWRPSGGGCYWRMMCCCIARSKKQFRFPRWQFNSCFQTCYF